MAFLSLANGKSLHRTVLVSFYEYDMSLFQRWFASTVGIENEVELCSCSGPTEPSRWRSHRLSVEQSTGHSRAASNITTRWGLPNVTMRWGPEAVSQGLPLPSYYSTMKWELLLIFPWGESCLQRFHEVRATFNITMRAAFNISISTLILPWARASSNITRRKAASIITMRRGLPPILPLG